ncbi:MAG: threonine/serine dehydratase [Candidatus Limnocylindrales bacterium]
MSAAADPIDVAAEVRAAEERARPYLLTTPVVPSTGLSAAVGSPVVLKCENLQHTGSFKARGAVNKLLSLSSEELERGVITASTGNHGAAVAYAGSIVGVAPTVVVPDDANPSKLAAIERLGGRIEVLGSDSVESELGARRAADERGMTFISPYNDRAIIGGQGTLGLELLEQVDDLSSVFVAVGGGGLSSGVAGIVKARSPETRVIGCSPANSAVMYHSLRAGRILDMPSDPTLSDGTAGGVEPGAITFDLLEALLDDFVTVEEAAIREAFLELIEVEHLLVEGSAAMAYAAARGHARATGGTTAVILCGGNVGVEKLRLILA